MSLQVEASFHAAGPLSPGSPHPSPRVLKGLTSAETNPQGWNTPSLLDPVLLWSGALWPGCCSTSPF